MKRKRLGRNYVPLGERFLAFYDNNDGRFYEKSELIANLISEL